MRKLLVLLIAVVSLILPASAAAQARHSCKPTTQLHLALSANTVVTCREAQTVDLFMNSHETSRLAFRAGNREWLGTIYSRAHGHTYFVFVSPGSRIGVVWVTVRIPVS